MNIPNLPDLPERQDQAGVQLAYYYEARGYDQFLVRQINKALEKNLVHPIQIRNFLEVRKSIESGSIRASRPGGWLLFGHERGVLQDGPDSPFVSSLLDTGSVSTCLLLASHLFLCDGTLIMRYRI